MKIRKMMERALAVVIVLAPSFSPMVSYVDMPGNVSAVMAATRSVGTEAKLRAAL